MLSAPQLDQSALRPPIAHKRHGVLVEKKSICCYEVQNKVKTYFFKNIGINAACLLPALLARRKKKIEKLPLSLVA